MRLTAIILGALLAIIVAGSTVLACHTHTSGYVTFTIALGETPPPMNLVDALPSFAPKTLAALPARKPSP